MSSYDHDKPQWKRDRDAQTGNSLAADAGPTPKAWKSNTSLSAKTDEAKQCINFQTMMKKRDDAEQFPKVNEKKVDELFWGQRMLASSLLRTRP